jgi:hypothetical protein
MCIYATHVCVHVCVNTSLWRWNLVAHGAELPVQTYAPTHRLSRHMCLILSSHTCPSAIVARAFLTSKKARATIAALAAVLAAPATPRPLLLALAACVSEISVRAYTAPASLFVKAREAHTAQVAVLAAPATPRPLLLALATLATDIFVRAKTAPASLFVNARLTNAAHVASG